MIGCILLYVAGFVAITYGELGRCTHKVTTDEKYDLDEFASDKDGQWKFWMVPEQWDALTYLDMDPTGNKDEYTLVMYKNENGGQSTKFLEGKLKETGKGQSTFVGKAGGHPVTFEMFFLKFVPKRYAYYYVCSNQENDLTTDYRYVVTHGPLNEKEVKEIEKIDNYYEFKGALKKNKVLDDKGNPKKDNKQAPKKDDNDKKKTR